MRFGAVISIVAVGTVLAVTSPASATPPPGGPAGRKCAYNLMTDLTRESGWEVGDINAGPLVTLEDGTLTCSIHVNNNTHSGASAVSVSFASVAGVVALGSPEVVHFQATAADDIAMCTSWTPTGGSPLYWVNGATVSTGQGHWDTDASSICSALIGPEPNDPWCPIWLAVDQRLGTNIAEIWQDCEPYEPII